MNPIIICIGILFILFVCFPKFTCKIIFCVLLYMYLPPMATNTICVIIGLSMLLPVAEPHR